MLINNPLIPGDPYSYDLKWVVAKVKEILQQLGTLDEAIDEKIFEGFLEHSVVQFKTVPEMLAADITDGSIVLTLGYHEAGDLGGLFYLVKDFNPSQCALDYFLTLDNNRQIAIPVFMTDYVTPEMFGAYGDGVSDDTEAMQAALQNKHVLLTGQYNITSDFTPIKGAYIEGNITPKQDDDFYPRIILAGEKQIILKENSNITIKNLVIQHEANRSSAVVDMASARYIVLSDLLFSHTGTATCNAIDDTVDYTTFSGYNTIRNVYATKYQTAIKTRASWIDIIGCTLTGCTERAIWKTTEGIGRIDFCDISKISGATDIPIQYDGSYGVFCYGCYFEGYPINDIVLTEKDVPIDIQASKLNLYTTSSGGGIYSMFMKRLHPTGGTANRALNLDNNKGEGTLENLVMDSALEYGRLFWTLNNNSTIVDDPVGGYRKAVRCTGGGNSQQIKGPFYAGEYVTLHAWVKKNNAGSSAPYLDLAIGQTTGISGTDFMVQRFNETDWSEFIIYIKVPSNTDYLTVIIHGDVSFTGVTLARGINPSAAHVGIGQTRVIMADNIVINLNGTYYKLNINTGTGAVTATAVTHI